MRKEFFAGVGIMLAGLLGMCGCAKRGPTVAELLAHFQQQGLSVSEPPPLSPEEKQFVDNFNRDLKQFRSLVVTRPSLAQDPIAEHVTKLIDGVRVDIDRYHDPQRAKKMYDVRVTGQERDEALVKRSGQRIRDYTTYFLHGVFFVEIPHYIVSVKDGRMQPPEPIEVDEHTIQRIQVALESFRVEHR